VAVSVQLVLIVGGRPRFQILVSID